MIEVAIMVATVIAVIAVNLWAESAKQRRLDEWRSRNGR